MTRHSYFQRVVGTQRLNRLRLPNEQLEVCGIEFEIWGKMKESKPGGEKNMKSTAKEPTELRTNDKSMEKNEFEGKINQQ